MADRYDPTVNCGMEPLTEVKRGSVKVGVCYENPLDPGSDFFLEIRLGKRRVRTAFCKSYEHELAVKELLEHLGFTPTVLSGKWNLDEDYS